MRLDAGVLWQSRGSGVYRCMKNLNGCVPQVPQSCQAVLLLLMRARARAPVRKASAGVCCCAARVLSMGLVLRLLDMLVPSVGGHVSHRCWCAGGGVWPRHRGFPRVWEPSVQALDLLQAITDAQNDVRAASSGGCRAQCASTLIHCRLPQLHRMVPDTSALRGGVASLTENYFSRGARLA